MIQSIIEVATKTFIKSRGNAMVMVGVVVTALLLFGNSPIYPPLPSPPNPSDNDAISPDDNDHGISFSSDEDENDDADADDEDADGDNNDSTENSMNHNGPFYPHQSKALCRFWR